ncbi:hypothetical protein P3T39_005192 [Kitasatospora sp. GP82]|nr:hypothetical protein [Kitasatospora sp. GP82]
MRTGKTPCPPAHPTDTLGRMTIRKAGLAKSE